MIGLVECQVSEVVGTLLKGQTGVGRGILRFGSAQLGSGSVDFFEPKGENNRHWTSEIDITQSSAHRGEREEWKRR